ncbi:penicillin-binding protein activator LpoB [Silvanigrella aquatica]|uniref:Penicillin-binding protein activator LpoB n=1 Tax=Silvanigrella aquatica TaxID=1915309 RepID=A0A1L4CZ73_9BACT|nr:penicillin-binding protein activator LpoB [Silvanigrella aquatica]APJ03263.1 penicillin-binding protein activator LpoB [Silvanigrella aquatica]
MLNAKRVLYISPLLVAVSLALSGCTSFQGDYGDPEQAQIIDDRWNPTDATMTVKKMVKDMSAAPWVQNWREDMKKKPTDRPFLLVDDMENRTSEVIDTKALFEDLRSQILNDGKVRFLDGDARNKILNEYKYQQSGVVKKDQIKGPGNQFGADFFLTGAISSIVSKQGGKSSVQYQIEMRLTNISTGELVWSGVEKIRKNFKRSSVGW